MKKHLQRFNDSGSVILEAVMTVLLIGIVCMSTMEYIGLKSGYSLYGAGCEIQAQAGGAGGGANECVNPYLHKLDEYGSRANNLQLGASAFW